MRQTIRFAKQTSTLSYISPAGYRVFEDRGGWKGWLSKRLWMLLHKLRALEPFLSTVETVTIEPRHHEDMRELVHESVVEVLDAGRKIEDFVLVIGAKEFDDIVGDIGSLNGALSFTLDAQYRMPHYPYQLNGIPIHVLPYVTGAALIEKKIIEERRR